MLKDFTVIEIRKRVGPMQMIIEPKRPRFSKPREEQGQKSTLVQNEALMATLHELMPELNDGQRHSVLGVYSSQDKAVIYDLKDTVIWHRGSHKKADADEMEEDNE